MWRDNRPRNKDTLALDPKGTIKNINIDGVSIYDYFFKCENDDDLDTCKEKNNLAENCKRCRVFNNKHLSNGTDSAGIKHRAPVLHLEEIIKHNRFKQFDEEKRREELEKKRKNLEEAREKANKKLQEHLEEAREKANKKLQERAAAANEFLQKMAEEQYNFFVEQNTEASEEEKE